MARPGGRPDEGVCGQGVHMIFDGDFTEPWGEGEARESRFCFIGRNLDRDRVRPCAALRRRHAPI